MPAIRVRGKGRKERTIVLKKADYGAIQDYLDERADTAGANPLLACCYAGDSVTRMGYDVRPI